MRKILSARKPGNGECLIFVSTLILFCFSVGFSQVGVTDKQLDDAKFRYEKWRTLVTDLTEHSVASSSALSDSENSFHLALLAKILWKHDQATARIYFKQSAEKLFAGLKETDKTKLERNLQSIQRTLEILFDLDEKQSTAIITRLGADLDATTNSELRKNPMFADIYAKIGSKIARANPRQALAYGTASLRYGLADELARLVVELNLKDSSMAEVLVKQALVKANANYTADSYLLLFNFSRYMTEFNKGRAFSSSIRRSVVEAFSNLLSGAVSDEQERGWRCGIAYYAPAVIPQVDEFLPEQASRFREHIQLCASFLPGSQRTKTNAKSESIPGSVDDILNLATETHDDELKIFYFREAFAKLEQAKKFDALISILEGFDGDDFRKVSPIGWDNWRVSAAFRSSLASFENGDIPAAYHTIDRTPKRLRPFVRKRLAGSATVSKNSDFFNENLNEMQKELNALEIPPPDAAELYLEIAQLYLKVTPSESEKMFREAVKYINKSDNDNPEQIVHEGWAPMEDYISLNAQLLEADEMSIFASLKDVSSPRSRLRLSLGLLESALKRLNESKEQFEALKRSRKKVS